MSAIGADLQQLSSGNSPYIELFEIQINETDFIYITNYIEGFGSSPEEKFNTIRFRDYDNPGTYNEYYPVPAQMDGIEHKSEGQFPQPSFTVANILRTTSGNDSLQSLLGSVSYGDLLGLKVIRRRTLQKYLEGGSGDANPPVELPRDIYYLDRIEDENPQSVTFTTVLPIDFTGVLLPRRNIIGNRCPWKYQGAGGDLNEWEKTGGCVWRNDSAIDVAGTTLYVYVNEDDEYIIDSTTSFTAYTSGVTRDSFYTTTESNLTKVGSDGTLTTGESSLNYWQNLTGVDTTPIDNSANWRRVRIFTDFSGTPSVDVYTDNKYNQYFRVDNSVGSTTNYTVWKAQSRSQSAAATPESGPLWERGDRCGKRLDSCKARFQVNPVVTLVVAGTSGLSVGETIYGYAGESSARVYRIDGTTLYLADVTGDFTAGEVVRNDDASPPSLNTTASGPISALPASNNTTKESAAMPFGGFPTARVFQ
jgi:lambda family phage minor tail protein L